MKTLITAVVAIMAAFMMTGCTKDQTKPYIVKTYSVVNDTIGAVKQAPGIITNNVPTMLTVSKTVRAALVFLGTKIGEAKVKPYVDAADVIISTLDTINQDPSQVTAKIETIVAKLDVVRNGLVELAKWAGCEGDLPTPKANTATVAQIAADAQQLQEMLNKGK